MSNLLVTGDHGEFSGLAEALAVRDGSAGGEVAHLANRKSHVSLAKERGAANKRIRSGHGTLNRCLQVNAPVHANGKAHALLVTPFICLLNLGEGLVDKRLTTKARVHSHDEHRVQLIQIRPQKVRRKMSNERGSERGD